MKADDSQIKLRIPSTLKTMIEGNAERNHRTINGEVVFLLEQALSLTNANTGHPMIKILNVSDEQYRYKRIVRGKLANTFDINYSQGLDELKIEIQLALECLIQTSLKYKFLSLNKNVQVYQGGNHLDVIDFGKGSLDWLSIEDHIVPHIDESEH